MSEILDSGNRTVFPGGAVRDIQEGKGRCDLLPLHEVAEMLCSTAIKDIANFQDTKDVFNLYAAIIHCDCFIDIYTTILEVAKHFEDGCNKYGERNWEKGIPVNRYIDSAVRHYIKHLRGDTDEMHDRAFVWNILCCIWTINHFGEGFVE